MSCTNIDITDSQQQTILAVVSSFITANIAPQSIVWEISGYLDMPKEDPQPPISSTNWCLVSCISSCLFRYSTYIPLLSSYKYETTIMECVSSCFPITVIESLATSNEAETTPMEAAKAAQLASIDNEKDATIKWYKDEIDRAALLMGITVASFALQIAIYAEQAGMEEIWAAMQLIGKGISQAASIISTAIGGLFGSDAAKAAATNKTIPSDRDVPLAAVLSEGMVDNVFSETTQVVADAGTTIESAGTIGSSITTIDHDTKNIALLLASLGAQLGEFISFIKEMVKRIIETTTQAAAMKETITEKYDDKISTIKDMTDQSNTRKGNTESATPFEGLTPEIISTKLMATNESIVNTNNVLTKISGNLT